MSTAPFPRDPSSVTTVQSLQYNAFSDKLVHDKQAKSIIDKDYLLRYIAVKSRTLYRFWLSIIKDKPGNPLYAAKAIYIPRTYSCRYEIVTKSSENLLFIGSFT